MAEIAKKEPPKFRVEQPPGFFDGAELHQPGTELVWEVPDDWDPEEKSKEGFKRGPHPMSYGPSLTFTPLNEAARALQEHHRKRVLEAKVGASAPNDEIESLRTELSQLKELIKGLTKK